MNLPLKGIIPPMITPLLDNENLDVEGLKNLIEHLIKGGVHGIFLLGTNGEGPSLSYALRKELIKKACEFANGRVPVLVGITDTTFEGSIDIANYSEEAGADAVVVAPPYYLPISENEMKEYLENLSKKLPLPFVLYNMPSCTKMHLSVDVVKKARELGAIGIKDSSGDMFYLYSLLEEFKNDPEFSIMVGTELFIPETVMNGGHGAIAGGANFFPKLFVDFYNASTEKDLEKIEELRKEVTWVYDTIYSVGKYISRYTKGTKCTLSVMGICNDYMAHPIRKFDKAERKLIQEYVEEFNERNSVKV
jgi:4-hydroxy-tetrahydrodipicolinate synthase